MLITTDGLVIKQKSIDEHDSLLTILTKERGVIYAYAKGARRLKSTLLPSTELLCYSHFVLFQNRDRYSVNSADLNQVFFGVREDIEKLSLATYFAQLSGLVLPVEEPEEEALRLFLNCMHLLEKDKLPMAQLKAVFELRLMTLCGFMPDLVGCANCGTYEGERMFFVARSGEIYCGNCREKSSGPLLELSRSVLQAMRHIIYSDFSKLFAFSLSEESLFLLGRAAENYTLSQVDAGIPTLDFYHSLHA
ncbi:DNA repair protein RecO [Zongyangia hominis]|uniref:DNA repair protein RecO n=1 Tax=Zongyangia hominis TaxID=2763677 RepID=A0A926EBQ7_9FIRM|nr:DNA repair protein RecO [Zongyangia hominis]MBC8570868.1 DNA repair protein RecO [Zongyangia hominis]